MIATIFIIFFTQCMHLFAMPNPEPNPGACVLSVNAVSMILYTRDIPNGKNIGIQECCENLNSSQPIVFLVHGFISAANMTRFQELASRMIETGRVVFALDWSQAACYKKIPTLTKYASAVNNTRAIGSHMANYAKSLIEKCHVPIEKITFIGHSLGAHVSGFAAKEVQKFNHGKIPLIIACDPAKPSFEGNECDERVCDRDTNRLVVFHTSAIGIWAPIGHLDIQFENGNIQPGCDFDFPLYVCSHSRSIDYIINVLDDDCGFPAVPIKAPSYPTSDTEDCIIINSKILNSNNSLTGHYYGFVKKKEPHCVMNSQQVFKCQQQ
ncbi:hypothetical protein P5V15_008996 [Pogonomyrmex californicus]